jgi:NADPH:quinone reductase-like Zn-dependent oxidoreductase
MPVCHGRRLPRRFWISPKGIIVVFGNTSGEPAPFNFMGFSNGQNARIQTLFHFNIDPPTAIKPDLATLADQLSAGRLKLNISGEHDWSELGRVVGELKRGRFRGKHVFRVKSTLYTTPKK